MWQTLQVVFLVFLFNIFIVFVLYIFLKSMASDHSWLYEIILCVLQMNIPSLIASLPSLTNLYEYE